jgi:processive 1,2-diacylglycerol beta-glucosyltransferase
VQAVLACGPVQVLAVAGRNDRQRRSLEKLAAPPGSALQAFGFVEQIAELMAVADVAVAKPGGLTTSECLAMGLPMLIHDPIPGQEERNADHVLEAGAGLKAHGLESLRFKLGGLLRDAPRLARMREAARAAGRPGAATTVVRALLGEA